MVRYVERVVGVGVGVGVLDLLLINIQVDPQLSEQIDELFIGRQKYHQTKADGRYCLIVCFG